MTTELNTSGTTLSGDGLTIDGLLDCTKGCPPIGGGAMARVTQAHRLLLAARKAGAVYGANTGVGANRGVRVDADGGVAHGLRLLRSHCAGLGAVEDDDVVRAAMLIRLNQMLVGGSGVSPALVVGLIDALSAGAMPTLHRRGSIGTGDLAPLAELALTLIGERPYRVGTCTPVALGPSDALPFISSNAVTIATSALGVGEESELLRAAEVVSALTFLALRGSVQAWDTRVHAARPHPHQVDVASRLTGLVSTTSAPAAARLQDPYGLRMIPQVHAPALAAADELRVGVEREMNAAAENPLVVPGGVLHHGQFHLATLAADLDHVRTTLLPVLTLSAARLSLLMTPSLSGLTPFLSDETAGSSGLMIAEYVAQDALAEARAVAATTSGASLNISLGLEEHASFASQGARQLRTMVHHARVLVALEAVSATRALRLAPERLLDCPAGRAVAALAPHLSPDMADRSIADDVEVAVAMLPVLAAMGGERRRE